MKKYLFSLGLVPIIVICVGCNVGNAPEPMSPTEVKKAVDELPPEKQIEWINRSPMPPEEKQRRIDEIRKKTGYSGGVNAPAAPGAPAVPGR